MARRSTDGPAPRLPSWALALVGAIAVLVLAIARLGGFGTVGRSAGHERIPTAPVPPLPAPDHDRAHDDRAPDRTDSTARRADTRTSTAVDVEGIGDAEERAAIVAIARAIDRGGPFAYRKDGAVFANRERQLPEQPRGHWREYTVPTPGSPDRGARRIIAGKTGELFYTRDHYRTFRRIRGPTRR